jgi:hypothetical protein
MPTVAFTQGTDLSGGLQGRVERMQRQSAAAFRGRVGRKVAEARLDGLAG